jgi:PAS domain S-box-containing protein
MALRVLFVEDRVADFELAERVLRRGGLDLTSMRVDTKAAFLAALADFAPDIVISDYSMPAFDGMSALRLAKASDPYLPFIVLTGATNEDTAVECMKAGAGDYVIKEHMARLPFAVREAIERQKARALADLSDRRLRESEERYRALFENSHAVMLIVDPERLAVVEANQAACEYYGWPKDALVGKGIGEISLLGEAELKDDLDDAVRRKNQNHVFRHRKANGTVVDVETHSGPIVLGGRAHLFSIVHDISDRKKAESELSLKSAALEAAANAIVITDRDGNIRWLNAAFESLTGFAREEAMGKNPRDLVRSGEQDAGFYRSLWDTILSGKMWQGEIVNRKKDGSLYTEEMTITPVRDESHGISGFIAIKNDVTERNVSRRRLEASLAEKQVLLQEIHHRINNNMQLITSLLSLSTQKITDHSLRELIGGVSRRIDSIALVHEQFYNSPDMARIDFVLYLHQLAEKLASEFPRHAEDLSITSSSDTIELGLEQAIPAGLAVGELLANALEHAYPGLPPRSGIQISLRRDGGDIELSVRDHGVGLPGGFAAEKAETLGMILVYTLAVQLRGSVEYRSRDGTEAVLRFPAT